MSLNATPSSERIHIGIFGRTNAGKSSLINALTGQSLAIVSDLSGTTTDPVSRAMELLPLGPVVITDTAGLGDKTELGMLREEKTLAVLDKTDIAIICVDINEGIGAEEEKIISTAKKRKIPFIIVRNKLDEGKKVLAEYERDICVSAKTGENIDRLKELLGSLSTGGEKKRLVGDLIKKGDIVLLVIPIDESAPKGRLILPQQQTIRDILEAGGVAVAVKDTELEKALEKISPALVITDSQAFKKVAEILPEEMPLTSFSILFSRYKGELSQMAAAAKKLENLKENDTILIAEGCTHHRQCGDIGTVKLPAWIEKKAGKKFGFEFVSGSDFPTDLSKYALIVHCGGCMLSEREVKNRISAAKEAGVPITNYGTMIAYINGILERSIKPLKGGEN